MARKPSRGVPLEWGRFIGSRAIIASSCRFLVIAHIGAVSARLGATLVICRTRLQAHLELPHRGHWTIPRSLPTLYKGGFPQI
jgi:hypothetical protein